MLKSQPLVIVLDQQKLLQLLPTCPGQAAALGVTLGDKMPQGRVVAFLVFPEGLTCPSGMNPALDVGWSKLGVFAECQGDGKQQWS